MLPPFLLDLLRSQHGLAAHHQIRADEPNPTARRAIHRHPDLQPASPRVLRHRAVAPCREQDILLGVLDAGPDALLWGKPGATLWGFGRFRLLPPHAAVPRRTLPRNPIAQLHRVRHLGDDERAVHLDIPTARPETIILWLLGMWTHRFGHETAVARGAVDLDQAWRQRLIDGEFIHALADRSGGRGRSGIVVLRSLLQKRPPDYQPAGSRLEERFEEGIGERVAARLDRQVTVDVEQAIRTVDFRARNLPHIVEINGEAFHTSLTDRAHDAARYRRLLELGYSVMVLWEYDVWHDIGAVRRAVSAYLRTPDAVPTLHRPTKAPWEW